MSFIGPLFVLNVKTSHGKNFKILISEQEGGFWVATVLYSDDGRISTNHLSGENKSQAYEAASSWVLQSLDKQAQIEKL